MTKDMLLLQPTRFDRAYRLHRRLRRAPGSPFSERLAVYDAILERDIIREEWKMKKFLLQTFLLEQRLDAYVWLRVLRSNKR